MTDFLAHSSRNGYPSQSYTDHIANVKNNAVNYAREVARYNKYGKELIKIVEKAAYWHDLGKLNQQNQNMLHQTNGKGRLPINHVDAGTTHLINEDALYSALVVYSHHKGLPNWSAESRRGNNFMRDENPDIREMTKRDLISLIEIHKELIDSPKILSDIEPDGDYAIFLRIALSCLADADHSDTGRIYGKSVCDNDTVSLKAEERLQSLNDYEMKLCEDNERSRLRHSMYESCRDTDINDGFVSCDSPVGSGKTTAVMAHLLKQAQKRDARRIFVILPYTNIINQSVEVYRNALVLPGENPEEVVVELHHRADFEDEDVRRLTALWRAPVIVTTTVAFFETLASNKPSTLRRLHELPGSMIFIDEMHAALPLWLLPLAWRWMNILEKDWSCYWVMASGSLVQFWRITELTNLCPKVPELVDTFLRERLMSYELQRIDFHLKETPQSIDDLIEWISSFPGPRLIVMNTVRNAAVISNEIRNRYGRNKVEHLSTALTGKDRAKSIKRIKQRLNDKTDNDWTLVATSCVEAGVDFSFRTGFREIASLLSLLQLSGRIGREGEYPNAEIWSFSMQDDLKLTTNPDIKHAAMILKKYFKQGIKIEPSLSTKAIEDELIQYDVESQKRKQLLESEKLLDFESVACNFNVIDSDTVPVVINREIANLFCQGSGDWKLLQKHSVSIVRCNLKKWNVHEIKKGLYLWSLPYDDFLGYMTGVLSI